MPVAQKQYLILRKTADFLMVALPSAGMAGASIAREAEPIMTSGGKMLRKLILALALVTAAGSPAATTTAWADGVSTAPAAQAAIAAAPAAQQAGKCDPGSPCAAVNCGPGRVCVPSPKQCFTTPCPQYDCVPISGPVGQPYYPGWQPPYPGWRPPYPGWRPPYPNSYPIPPYPGWRPPYPGWRPPYPNSYPVPWRPPYPPPWPPRPR
ncbi:hypothetical protein GCM10009525_02860 [Streptosporangium amethystogenes subsp. fukuiense]